MRDSDRDDDEMTFIADTRVYREGRRVKKPEEKLEKLLC